MSYYQNAHLVVAAIRIVEHQKQVPSAIKDICQMLSFSEEQGNLLCKKLADAGIIEMVRGVYGPRLYIKDHLKIEEIPREDGESRLDEALKQFKDSKLDYDQKIAAIKAEQAAKKKKIEIALEKQLKEKLKSQNDIDF
jgi:hypothetical protein